MQICLSILTQSVLLFCKIPRDLLYYIVSYLLLYLSVKGCYLLILWAVFYYTACYASFLSFPTHLINLRAIIKFI